MWRIARLGRANRRSSLPLSPSHYHENRFPFSFSFPRFFPRFFPPLLTPFLLPFLSSSVFCRLWSYPVTFCSCELDGIFRRAPIAVINIRRSASAKLSFVPILGSYIFFFLFFPRLLNILRSYLDGFTAIISSNRFRIRGKRQIGIYYR